MILKTVSLLLAMYWQNLTFFLFEAAEWFVTEEGSKNEVKEVKGRGGAGYWGKSHIRNVCIVVGGFVGLLFQLSGELGT